MLGYQQDHRPSTQRIVYDCQRLSRLRAKSEMQLDKFGRNLQHHLCYSLYVCDFNDALNYKDINKPLT